jgi:hypothetical protein
LCPVNGDTDEKLTFEQTTLLEESAMSSVPDFAEFLASYPPGKEAIVNHVVRQAAKDNALWCLNAQDIRIECHSDECDGLRYFECIQVDGVNQFVAPETEYWVYLHFVCRNCRLQFKTIAATFTSPQAGNLYCKMLKLGEHPPFGARVPARVSTLVGPDREVFLKGRRSELQGLGIGAFAYYRRVIENQKSRLLDEIIGAARKLNAPQAQIQALEAAKTETQFSKAVGSVKEAIPSELLIKGRNPLSLLHSALSEGLHASTDEQCLELATSIREVLFELAERIGRVVKEQVGLDAAVARLTQDRESVGGK